MLTHEKGNLKVTVCGKINQTGTWFFVLLQHSFSGCQRVVGGVWGGAGIDTVV